jgi:hypothetical protein
MFSLQSIIVFLLNYEIYLAQRRDSWKGMLDPRIHFAREPQPVTRRATKHEV